MAYLDLHRNEYDQLTDELHELVNECEAQIPPEDLEVLFRNIDDFEPNSDDSAMKSIAFPSIGYEITTIEADFMARMEGTITELSVSLHDTPDDVETAEALVRAVINLCKVHGASRPEVTGRPGDGVNIALSVNNVKNLS